MITWGKDSSIFFEALKLEEVSAGEKSEKKNSFLDNATYKIRHN